jgi:hypothetical protein
LFDQKEYIKAASVLTEYSRGEFPESHFLYNYAMYMFGEYRKEEESMEEGQGENKNISSIIRSLEETDEPLGLYLLGVAYKN